MHPLKAFSLQGLLIFGYCFGQGAKSPSQKSSPAETFVDFGNAFFKTIRSKPVKERVQKIKNRHSDSDFDDWCTRDYPLFKVVVVRPIGFPPELLAKVALSDPKVTLPLGISLGDKPEKIIKIIGTPHTRKPGLISYEVGDLLSESATLFFKADHLVRIEWDYEID